MKPNIVTRTIKIKRDFANANLTIANFEVPPQGEITRLEIFIEDGTTVDNVKWCGDAVWSGTNTEALENGGSLGTLGTHYTLNTAAGGGKVAILNTSINNVPIFYKTVNSLNLLSILFSTDATKITATLTVKGITSNNETTPFLKDDSFRIIQVKSGVWNDITDKVGFNSFDPTPQTIFSGPNERILLLSKNNLQKFYIQASRNYVAAALRVGLVFEYLNTGLTYTAPNLKQNCSYANDIFDIDQNGIVSVSVLNTDRAFTSNVSDPIYIKNQIFVNDTTGTVPRPNPYINTAYYVYSITTVGNVALDDPIILKKITPIK